MARSMAARGPVQSGFGGSTASSGPDAMKAPIADEALDRAKTGVRNRVESAPPDLVGFTLAVAT